MNLLSISFVIAVGAGGDASKMMRSDVLDSGIVWPPASPSNKLMQIENTGGELRVVTSVPGGSVWGRISDVDRDGVMSRVNITTLMMISALTNVWQKNNRLVEFRLEPKIFVAKHYVPVPSRNLVSRINLYASVTVRHLVSEISDPMCI